LKSAFLADEERSSRDFTSEFLSLKRITQEAVIYDRLLSSVRSRLGLQPAIVRSSVLGTEVKVRDGTFPRSPDYDDAWLYALITHCNVFFDVGSNLGEMSLLACLDNPLRNVVVMDANPSALATAAENLFLNGFSRRVRFVQAFIADTENEEVEFFTVGTGQAGSRFRSHAKTASGANCSFKTRTTTLDIVARETNLPPDLIKIDVEGAESEVLAGSRELASHLRPRFIVEMHAFKELSMRQNGERVLNWCSEVDYEAYYLKRHVMVTSPDLFANRGRCHLYLQPKGHQYPSFLKEIAQEATLDEARAALKLSHSIESNS
jgi:FkbM family methyltransferase